MLRLALSRSSSTVLPRALLGAVTASNPIATPLIRRSHLQTIVKSIPNQIFRNNFSSVASDDASRKTDRKLRKALKREIKSFEPSDVESPEAPADFPFKIEDDIPGSLTVKLKREFEGEKIEVEVFPTVYPDEVAAGDGEEIPAKVCGGCPNEDRIQLIMNITKEDGEKLEINFWGVYGYGFHPIMFKINGVPFADEKVLGFDWMEIVRARGVNDSITVYMMEYMNRRCDRNHLNTLKKFRDFIKA